MQDKDHNFNMIIDEKVLIKVNSRTLKKLREFGYTCEINEWIYINPLDYTLKKSQFYINAKCTKCKYIKRIKWDNYIINTNFHKKEYCCSIKCAIEKRCKTNLEKYGVEHIFQLEDIKNKSKETYLKNYGVDHFMKSEEQKSLFKSKMIEKYGVDSAIKSPEIKEKIAKTNLEKYGVENYFNLLERSYISDRLKDTNLNYMKSKYNFIIDLIETSLYLCKCEKCGGLFEINTNCLNRRYSENREICTICNPLYSSYPEVEIENILKEKNIEFERKNRTLCKPYELDFLIDSFAIEFNGLYWHSEIFKNKMYHFNKVHNCRNLNISLFHIWEDDWKFKRNIIKSMILNRLGKTSNKIYARKCEIKKVNNSEAKQFLNDNHIQGYISCKLQLGLYHNNELISLMTFSNKFGKYELLRFCSKININVPGGASKLFKYFLQNYNPSKVITYSNNDYSNIYLYKKLNFELISESGPNYFWINGIRENRFDYKKEKIKLNFDKTKTEEEIMHNLGYYRIYDSGYKKWTYKF